MNRRFTRVGDAEFMLNHDLYDLRVLAVEYEVLQSIHAGLLDIGVASRFAEDRQFNGWSLIASPPGASKWNGVLAFCDALGIDQNAVLAVGDGVNDIELFENAARS